MKKTLFYLVLLSLMAACKKTPAVDCNSPTKNPEIARQLIVGSWIWVYSKFSNRILGITEIWTPVNKNSIRTMQFDKKGNLTIFENGKMTVEATYSFRKLSEFTKFPADSTQFILSWKNSDTFFTICTDSLYLPRGIMRHDANEVWVKN